MNELISVSSDWFLVWLFPVLFVLSASVTKKDMAIVCSIFSVLSAWAYTGLDASSWSYEEVLVFNGFLNLSVAFWAHHNWSSYRTKLSRCIVWIASAAVVVNSIRVVIDSIYTFHALLLLQAAALAAILKLDGSKEISNGIEHGVASASHAVGGWFSDHMGSKG